MATVASTLEVAPVAGALGAEILGVDLARDLGNDEMARIHDAFRDHGVVFFRDQRLTPERQIAFARRFGEIEVNRFFAAVPGHPEVAEVRKEPHQRENIGGGWHTDHSYDVAPALGSVLHAIEVPEAGGDTEFASMYAAYESLSGGMKRLLEGLRAVHSSRHVFGQPDGRRRESQRDGRIGNPQLATQEATHPVVVTHPLSGRRALYVNPGFTVRFEGWTRAESRPLLDHLYEHAARPEHTCRFRWRPGSVAFWDNRATWHRAVNDYHGRRRLMHRVTIAGSPLG